MSQAPPQEIIDQKRAEKLKALEADEPVIQKAFVAKMGEVDEENRTIPFILSTPTVDRENDSIAVEGWNLTTYLETPIVLWAHNASENTHEHRPIGKNHNTRIESNALRAETQFIGEDETSVEHFQFCDSIYRMYLHGYLTSKSVGFRPLKWSWNEDRGFWAIDYEEQELLEDSCVPIPANPEALIQARSHHGINTAPIAEWAGKFLETLPIDDATRRKVFEETWKHGKDHTFFQRVVADLEPPKKSAGNGLSVDLNLDFGDSFERIEAFKGALIEVDELADRVAAKTSAILAAPTKAVEGPAEEPPAAEDTPEPETTEDEEPTGDSETKEQPVFVRLIL